MAHSLTPQDIGSVPQNPPRQNSHLPVVNVRVAQRTYIDKIHTMYIWGYKNPLEEIKHCSIIYIYIDSKKIHRTNTLVEVALNWIVNYSVFLTARSFLHFIHTHNMNVKNRDANYANAIVP